jgi:hypothetical protein
MAYTELVAVWTGVSGLPGYSKFRFVGVLSGAQINSAAANIKALFDAVKSYIPAAIGIAVQASASVHDDDGTLQSEQAVTVLPAPTACTGAGAYSAASGALINWATGAINGGKKVRGRTFLVPVVVNAFQTDGTLLDATRTAIQNAASTFVGSTPTPAINSRKKPDNPLSGDQTSVIISAAVPDKQVVLRSRRD